MAMPVFHPIRTERIYQKIVDQIREMIAAGRLSPGDRLPSEREIAEQLAVSRTAVREAFSALELAGLIEVRPGEGSFVRGGDVSKPIAELLAIEQEQAHASEMYEFRRPLEGEAAALAALRATEEDLAHVRVALIRMEQDLVSADLGEAADWEFHHAVAMASHNGLILKVMQHLQDALRRSLKTARRRLYSIADMPQRLLAEHVEIYEAIRARDPERARACMLEHITQAQKNSEL